MNKAWVDDRLRFLQSKIAPGRDFEPTAGFYRQLRDTTQLQDAVRALCRFTDLAAVPAVEVVGDSDIPLLDFQTGRRYTEKTINSAGDFHWEAPFVPQIRVGISQCYRPRRLGQVLAHEIAHCALDWRQTHSVDLEEEMLTDLAAVWLGLGKLLINGASDSDIESVRKPLHLTDCGKPYLGYPLLAYAYVQSWGLRGLSSSPSYRWLTGPAVAFVRALDARRPGLRGWYRIGACILSLFTQEPETDGSRLLKDSWKSDPNRHRIVPCPRCQVSLRIPATDKTLEVRCPRCGHQFEVRIRF